MNILELFVFLWGIFALAKAEESVAVAQDEESAAFKPFFVSPVATNTYYYNQGQVKVEIDFSLSPTLSVAVTQKCGSDVKTVAITRLSSSTNIDLPADYTGPCDYSGTYDLFFKLDPVTITINGIITIETPKASGQIPSGTVTPISWSYLPLGSSVPFFQAFLTCPSVGQDESQVVQDTLTVITVSSSMYGSDCYVNVNTTSPYLTLSSVPVIVTQTLSFSTPQEGDIIVITDDFIPVLLVTSGENQNEEVFLTFSCESGPELTQKFITNVEGFLPLNQAQVGVCIISITDYPSYLVPTELIIEFDLQYSIKYTNLPSILYLGQQFTIQIDTLTLALSPPLLDMNLICSDNIVFQTFLNVTVNQPNDLILDQAVPLEACYFSVIQSIFYPTTNSIPIQVSKVPVTIDQPTSPGPYIQANLIDLSVSTTVNPVNGIVHLELFCPSFPGSYNLEVGIDRETKFTPPANAYGLCNIQVVDPIFQAPGPVNFEIAYKLDFSAIPSTIYLNQTFNVYIQTSSVVPESLTSNLYLLCNETPAYTWNSVALNQLVQLLVPSNLVLSNNCVFQTDGAPNFVKAISPVALSTLTLNFIEPVQISYVQPDIIIPVLVSSSNITNPTGFVNISIFCLMVAYDYRQLVELNVETFINVPSYVYGPCLFYSSSSLYINPAPLPISFSVQLSFVNPPPIIYEGQLFNITIAATGNPNNQLTANLLLICPVNYYKWNVIALNQMSTLMAPLNFPQSNDCYFTTQEALFLIPAPNSPVAVSNVPLKFVQPTSKTFIETQLVPIEVMAVNYPEIETPINVTWSCAQAGYYNNTISMVTSVEQQFPIDSSVFGLCALSVDNPPLGFNAPVPYSFNVIWELVLSDYPQILYPSQPFPILVTPSLPASLATSTTVQLVCDGTLEQSWSEVPFDTLVYLTVNPFINPSVSCYLRTNTEVQFVIDAVSTQISVGVINLVINLPLANSTTVIPNTLPLLVSTPLNTSILYNAFANLYCNDSALTSKIPFTTNIVTSVNYGEGFYGPCTISVGDVLPEFRAPAPVDFYLKFDLEFTESPKFISLGGQFVVEITPSGVVPAALNEISMNLVCDATVIETWNNIKLSQPQTLVYDNVSSVPLFNCSLQTVADDEIFIEAITSVEVINFQSPFGGPLFYISPRDVIEFTKNLSSVTLWVDITSN